MSVATRSYEIQADAQNRVIIRDVRFDRYHVEVRGDGSIFLSPTPHAGIVANPGETCQAEKPLTGLEGTISDIEDLRNPQDDGIVFKTEDLDWLKDFFQSRFPQDLSYPYIYPMDSNIVSAEWDMNHGIDVEINIAARKGVGIAHRDAETEFNIDFDDADSVARLFEILRSNDE